MGGGQTSPTLAQYHILDLSSVNIHLASLTHALLYASPPDGENDVTRTVRGLKAAATSVSR